MEWGERRTREGIQIPLTKVLGSDFLGGNKTSGKKSCRLGFLLCRRSAREMGGEIKKIEKVSDDDLFI